MQAFTEGKIDVLVAEKPGPCAGRAYPHEAAVRGGRPATPPSRTALRLGISTPKDTLDGLTFRTLEGDGVRRKATGRVVEFLVPPTAGMARSGLDGLTVSGPYPGKVDLRPSGQERGSVSNPGTLSARR